MADCRFCGTGREACDLRATKHPKRCCPVCKENGPDWCHGEEVPSGTTRFHPQVQRVPHGPWCAPSVGGITDGFATSEEVQALFTSLRKFDAEYYAHAKFRILKRTEEICWEES